jgi:uncharacterized protein YkwD
MALQITTTASRAATEISGAGSFNLTVSPTASSTPVNLWPSRTTTPTKSYTPLPSSTEASPTRQPPAPPTATSTVTSRPSFTPKPTSSPQASGTSESQACSTTINADYEATLVALINEARQEQGLQPLVGQSQLISAARAHSRDMACNDFISHTGSDGSRPADRVSAQGYDYSWVGENIFAGNSSPQATFDWWMNSEPHRNNILHSNYTEIGVGYSYLAGSRFRSHFTAVFARPR